MTEIREEVHTMANLTEAQAAALKLLQRARDEDRAVEIAGSTQWSYEPTVRRSVAEKLVEAGVARYSRPAGRYLLLVH